MRLAGAALGLLLFGTAAAAASSYDDFNAGLALRNHEEFANSIAYLSRALAALDLPEHLREPALLARGLDFEDQHNHAAAEADLTAAIQRSPKLVSGYLYRAGIEEELKAYDAAITDYTSAIALKPFITDLRASRGTDFVNTGRYAEAETDFAFYTGIETDDSIGFFQLGFAQWAQGHFDKALASFNTSRELDAKTGYNVVWREIAEQEANARDSTLRRDARKVEEGKWPAPIVDLFAGRTKSDDVLAAAGKGEPGETDRQKCEAAFYVAEWNLEQKDTAGALPLFARAKDSCPDGFIEKIAAGIELSRLAQAGTSR
jgi:lipoprotein NlpI